MLKDAHTHIYVHIRSNLGSRLFWIKYQRPRYFVSSCVQCPDLHSPSTMAGRIVLAGAAQPIPGRTKEEGARIVLDALRHAMEGLQVLHLEGQQREWLHRRFIASQLGVGLGQWKHFKRVHASEIELDGLQQWVRLRPSAAD